jgi:ferredoxin
MLLASLSAAASRHGLLVRGGFRPTAEDGVPALPDGRNAATLMLVGNAGPAMWRAFRAAPERIRSDDALDAWTRRVVAEIARGAGAHPLFPFEGPPYFPFQRWAMRAEPVHPSPLGILIHPEFGLWHAYRAALAFAEAVDLPEWKERARPCESCERRPCLSACPVGAFDGVSYAVHTCAAHLDTEAGRNCLDGGCRARDACPVGAAWRYDLEQVRFHMAAFHAARRRAAALGEAEL